MPVLCLLAAKPLPLRKLPTPAPISAEALAAKRHKTGIKCANGDSKGIYCAEMGRQWALIQRQLAEEGPQNGRILFKTAAMPPPLRNAAVLKSILPLICGKLPEYSAIEIYNG
ncbi:hypothetical protein B9Z55_008982 [Caenorhabditis nigoni]|uniref:Uncharacterized protein n=1 Tax=Caenorhabditis nigoni TaxID=1611254 RepID=A0A2G5UQ46_9PELO|nr:hypothetical protein B9Z55_008982 [Caenorhabditis nigoni]